MARVSRGQQRARTADEAKEESGGGRIIDEVRPAKKCNGENHLGTFSRACCLTFRLHEPTYQQRFFSKQWEASLTHSYAPRSFLRQVRYTVISPTCRKGNHSTPTHL